MSIRYPYKEHVGVFVLVLLRNPPGSLYRHLLLNIPLIALAHLLVELDSHLPIFLPSWRRVSWISSGFHGYLETGKALRAS
jgi:hypothetical protein